jgi:hypothetical protein
MKQAILGTVCGCGCRQYAGRLLWAGSMHDAAVRLACCWPLLALGCLQASHLSPFFQS